MFITGYSQQSMQWFVENGNGWMYYPQSPDRQELAIHQWRSKVERNSEMKFKPFSQPMHLDLAEDPDSPPIPIHLGYEVGRNYLIDLLETYQDIGVNHLFFALFDGKRPANEVIQELGEYVVPLFPAH